MNLNGLVSALGGKSAKIGLVMLVVALVATGMLFSKDRIATMMMGGSTIKVHFDQDYKLRAHISKVKVAYVEVGKVTGVEQTDDGAVVSLKVDDDVLDRLGSEPTATIRPTTLLGGSYFVDLQPGGAPGAFTARSIPVERAKVPVELDKVARALQPNARKGVQGTVKHLDRALNAQGRQALERLLKVAPAALKPAPGVLAAAQGEQPKKDVAAIVSGIESTSRVLTERQGELAAIVDDLNKTSAVLDRRGPEIADAVAELPEALHSTDQGLADLSGSLTTLTDVSAQTRPLAQQLGKTLATAEPLLREARPLVKDTRVLLRQSLPMLRQLTPTATSADQVLDDVEGRVLDQLNDKVAPALHAKYHGKAPYQFTESEKPLYEEVAYMAADAARAAGMTDRNGNALTIQFGAGLESVGSFLGVPAPLSKLHRIAMEMLDPSTLGIPTLDGLLNGGGGR